MDRNTAIGLLLMLAFVVGYTYFTAPTDEEVAAMEAAKQEQLDSLQQAEKPVTQTIPAPPEPAIADPKSPEDSLRALI